MAAPRGSGISFTRLSEVLPASPTTSSRRNALTIVAGIDGTSRVTDDDLLHGQSCDLLKGDVAIRDLRHSGALRYSGGADVIVANVPIPILRDFALQSGWRELSVFATADAFGRYDPSLALLMGSLAPYFAEDTQPNATVVDHISRAILAHVLVEYFAHEAPAATARTRLLAWQERRARELIDTNLAGDINIPWLAAQFDLSHSHFARAFKEAVGVAPYQWVIERRVGLAKELMRDRSVSLADVAVRCGFADQSHFSRAFSKVTGTPPGIWRRNEDDAAPDSN